MEKYELEQNERDEILMNEDALIAGLLEAANFRNDQGITTKVKIKRGDKALFEFRVHPLSEEDISEIRKKCTRYAPDPRGSRYGRVETDVDHLRLRSLKIYEATVEADRDKLWDNPKVKQRLNCLDPVDVIEQALMAGEKDGVVDLIDKISGYGESIESLETHAKN